MAITQTHVIQRFANALYAQQVGSQTLTQVEAEISATSMSSVFNSYYVQSFADLSPAQIAANLVQRLGISVAGTTIAKNYIIDQLSNTAMAERGAKVAQILELYSGLTADPIFGASAQAWNAQVEAATGYTGVGNVRVGVGSSFASVTGQENLVGTVFDDTFSVTLQAAAPGLPAQGSFDGLAGTDLLNAVLQSASASIDTNSTARLVTRGVETISLQSQYTGNLPAGSARDNVGTRLDASGTVGVMQWESKGSGADLAIDNVRIRDDQVTKDITITMRDTAAGQVDYGVYFDQNWLRNSASTTEVIRLELINTRSAAAGFAPLLGSPYDGFVFTVTDKNSGIPKSILLLSIAIKSAQTYAELAAAYQNALDAALGVGAISVSVGSDFTMIDTKSGKPVTGQQINLTATGSLALTTPAGSGFLSTSSVPPDFFHTNFISGSPSRELITSKIILDNVGLGSTGGDLVVGGLSVGDTSTSKGV
jgi:hypothetical protein